MFQDWQEITNSIFCGGPAGLRQQMDVWFYDHEGTTAERHERELKTLNSSVTRSSEARRESFCPLDTDVSWKSRFRKLARIPHSENPVYQELARIS